MSKISFEQILEVRLISRQLLFLKLLKCFFYYSITRILIVFDTLYHCVSDIIKIIKTNSCL